MKKFIITYSDGGDYSVYSITDAKALGVYDSLHRAVRECQDDDLSPISVIFTTREHHLQG